MYNCITTFPQKYDAYVNKTFDVHLKFNKFHYSHTIVAMVSLYDQNTHLIYGFDQFVIWLYSKVTQKFLQADFFPKVSCHMYNISTYNIYTIFLKSIWKAWPWCCYWHWESLLYVYKDQFQTLKSFETLHLNLPFQMRSWNLSVMMLSFIQLSIKNWR
jgi:hypothetical protein